MPCTHAHISRKPTPFTLPYTTAPHTATGHVQLADPASSNASNVPHQRPCPRLRHFYIVTTTPTIPPCSIILSLQAQDKQKHKVRKQTQPPRGRLASPKQAEEERSSCLGSKAKPWVCCLGVPHKHYTRTYGTRSRPTQTRHAVSVKTSKQGSPSVFLDLVNPLCRLRRGRVMPNKRANAG